MTSRTPWWVVSLSVVAGAVLPGTALAAPKLISVCPSGCDFTSINTAVNDPGTNAGDSIQVEPGTYTEQVSVGKKLSIFGDSSGPRPVVTFAPNFGDATFTVTGGSGGSISHLDIRATSGSSGLVLDAAVTASDLSVSEPGGDGVLMAAGTLTDSTLSGGTALDMFGGTARRVTLSGVSTGLTTTASSTSPVVSDSVITSSFGTAVLAKGTSGVPSPIPVKLRNVTAYGAANGLEAQATGNSGGAGGDIDAQNVIVRGAGTDVVADPGGMFCFPPNCFSGVVNISYSNFVTGSGGFNSMGHDQSSDPMLVNPVVGAGEDFHVSCSGSPVAGAGSADAANGPSDRDGVTHPDPPSIGAYEFVPCPPSGDTAAPPGGTENPPGGGSGGATAAKCKKPKKQHAVAAKKKCKRRKRKS